MIPQKEITHQKARLKDPTSLLSSRNMGWLEKKCCPVNAKAKEAESRIRKEFPLMVEWIAKKLFKG